MTKSPKTPPQSQKTHSPLARFIIKLLLIFLVAICMGFSFIVIFSMVNLLAIAACATRVCTDNGWIYFLAAFGATATLSNIIGALLLRHLVKISWTTSIAAILISFVATGATTQVAISFYGENVLSYPATFIMAAYPVLLALLIFLFDKAEKQSYWLAPVLFAASVVILPQLLATVGQTIRVERNTQRVGAAAQKASLDVYSPRYMPQNAKLVSADSRSYMGFKYELGYSTTNNFNPYAHDPHAKTFQISGNAYNQETTPICDNAEPADCQKIGTTKYCAVHRKDNIKYNSNSVQFYCVAEKTHLKLSGNTKITNEEVIKVFESLQPGIVKTP